MRRALRPNNTVTLGEPLGSLRKKIPAQMIILRRFPIIPRKLEEKIPAHMIILRKLKERRYRHIW